LFKSFILTVRNSNSKARLTCSFIQIFPDESRLRIQVPKNETLNHCLNHVMNHFDYYTWTNLL